MMKHFKGLVKHRKGFTLIELLVVIAIIGLLATLAIISFSGAQLKARDAKRVSDMKILQTAIEAYGADNEGYDDLSTPCPPGTGVKDCGELASALPDYQDITDPSWGDAADCVDPDSQTFPSLLNCEYTIGTITGTTYEVFFATEGSTVQGLRAGQRHQLTEAGTD